MCDLCSIHWHWEDEATKEEVEAKEGVEVVTKPAVEEEETKDESKEDEATAKVDLANEEKEDKETEKQVDKVLGFNKFQLRWRLSWRSGRLS